MEHCGTIQTVDSLTVITLRENPVRPRMVRAEQSKGLSNRPMVRQKPAHFLTRTTNGLINSPSFSLGFLRFLCNTT